MKVRMCHVCRTCGHEYGRFRPRCPACGTDAPRCKHGRNEALCDDCRDDGRAPVVKAHRVKRAKRERPDRVGCILCRRRVKLGRRSSTTCPHCDEAIHVGCLELHRDACAVFQVERRQVYDALLDKAKPGSPSSLSDPVGTARKVVDLIKGRVNP